MVDRVSFDGEIFSGERQRTKMDQFVAEPGDLVVSKIRARQGSVGLVDEGRGRVSVTIHYRVLTPDASRIIPRYAHLALRSRFGRLQFLAATGGAMKGEISEESLLELKLPLPPQTIQEKIVHRWQSIQTILAQTEKSVRDVGRELQTKAFAALGLKLIEATELPKLLIVHWRDVSRWSVSYNQQVQAGMDLTHGSYPVVTLNSVLTMVQYGTSQKANSDGHGTPIIRMNNLVDGRLVLNDLKHIELPARERASLLLEDGDILINRTNSKELVGKCAVFHESGEYVFASYLIRLRTDPAKADPDYVAWAVNSPIGRQQIDAMSRQIIGQANINTEEIRSLEIPLPPLETQQQIMAEVRAGLDEIAKLRAKAQEQADAARAEVEKAIIGAA